jgi:hypothetical protein
MNDCLEYLVFLDGNEMYGGFLYTVYPDLRIRRMFWILMGMTSMIICVKYVSSRDKPI